MTLVPKLDPNEPRLPEPKNWVRGLPMESSDAVWYVAAQIDMAREEGRPLLPEMIDLVDRHTEFLRRNCEDHARMGYPVAQEFLRPFVVFEKLGRLLKLIQQNDKEITAILSRKGNGG